ncbi:acyl-CoA dehydrogenase family protein [Halioglobus pacificus]|uniref:Acyl-CoA dehydrogenase FadE n=1 Tax=Parahalioglobus pacificus TaxID=930806 RepID=A0A918XML7_9GAMM|nr:acyl-CoA dehydrogenase family protein [Halioglobus pacificus]GHD37964.1 putative acyl-CoA dehydrogenase FadE [Halioglobus pacificus]
MDFTFSEDQYLFRDSVGEFLRNEVTPERIRAGWESPTGRDDALWQALTELGVTGLTVPESHGGLGMSAVDFVLLAQECGYVALPEPLVNTALVAVPVLQAVGGELAATWLPKVADGSARVVCGLANNQLAEDAHVADLLLWCEGDALFALHPGQFTARANASVDPSRRLYAIAIEPGVEPVLTGAAANAVGGLAMRRGALGAAAQCLGLAQRMIDMSVAYTSDRQQFGKPIGSFQAVKHHMANVAVRLEYAKPAVARAAYSLFTDDPGAQRHVAHAKLAACDAANLAAKHSIQVHGAMGYTWEVDLHIFMKKAWALAGTWGDSGFHKACVMDYLMYDDARLGATGTFS